MRGFLCLSVLLCALIAINAQTCPTSYPYFVGNVSTDDPSWFSFRSSFAYDFYVPVLDVSLAAVDTFNFDSHHYDVLSVRFMAGIYDILNPADSTPPTISMGYFTLNETSTWNGTFNPTDPFLGLFDIGVFATAASTVFDQVFEFKDTNHNGKYDINDTIISSFPMASLTWGQFCKHQSSIVSNNSHSATLYIYNISSTANPLGIATPTVSLQIEVATAVGITNKNVVVGPKSVKIDIAINNYPYTSNHSDTMLGMSTLFGNAQFNADMRAAFDGNFLGAGNGTNQVWFSWDSTAEVDGLIGSVQATLNEQYNTSSGLPGLANSLIFSGGVDSTINVNQMFYTFPGTQPRSVYWDPAIGNGPRLQTSVMPIVDFGKKSSGSNSVAIGLGVTGAILGVILIGALVYRYMKNKNSYATETEGLYKYTKERETYA